MKALSAAVAALALVSSAACNSMSSTATAPSAVPTSTTARASEPTIAGIASSAGFTYLVAALNKAGLTSAFDGNVHYTVFAPTNAAFDAAAKALLQDSTKTGPDLVAALDVATLQAVLKYHVTRGDRNATSVVSAGSLRMLDGNTATITAAGGGAKIDDANIIQTDITASNGIIHVIDAVILP